MRRRDFIAGTVGTAAAWPIVARAQGAVNLPVIGYLDPDSAENRGVFATAFREGLAQTGFMAGQSVTIEYRWAHNHVDQLPRLAADLVHREVKLICVGGNIAAQQVHAATKTIPVVFVVGNDPVKLGLVTSLDHPGGNLTGITPLNADLGPKRLQLFKELVPTARVIALLVNPANPLAEAASHELGEPAATLGLKLYVVRAGNDAELDASFATLVKAKVGALMIGADSFFNGRTKQLAGLALRHRIPAIYETREFAAAGGLASYGASITDAFRVAGIYAGRILKGEAPANLPVQQSMKVELTINLKTAKALGLSVPITLLARADEVIE